MDYTGSDGDMLHVLANKAIKRLNAQTAPWRHEYLSEYRLV
jgi:hypothetical protein